MIMIVMNWIIVLIIIINQLNLTETYGNACDNCPYANSSQSDNDDDTVGNVVTIVPMFLIIIKRILIMME